MCLAPSRINFTEIDAKMSPIILVVMLNPIVPSIFPIGSANIKIGHMDKAAANITNTNDVFSAMVVKDEDNSRLYLWSRDLPTME